MSTRPLEWQNHTQAEIDAAADREGFVAAYPAALEGRWNYTGQLSDKISAGDQIADDVGFIGKLIDHLGNIADPSWVYAIGESHGRTDDIRADVSDGQAHRRCRATDHRHDGRTTHRVRAVTAGADGTADPIQWYDGCL